jgi:phosphoglycerate kinase
MSRVEARSFEKLTIRDLELRGKRLLLRVDFNVPLRRSGVADDARLVAALPTLRLACERGARVLLLSHLGRPKGKRVPDLSLAPVAARLGELLGRPVPLAPDCIGEAVQAQAGALRDGDLLLLENCRFHPGDEANDEAFARALADLADCYVNDAFGAAHRAHASTVGVTRFLRPAAAGLLMERELRYLGTLRAAPAAPFVLVLGGAKVSDKLGVLLQLLPRVDAVLVGGGMAYTFLRAQGAPVGASLVEADRVEAAREILAAAAGRGTRFLLPLDHVIAERPAPDAPTRVVATPDLAEGWMGLDIGPRTREAFARVLASARTIFWNGPLGVFEHPPFREGTLAVARAIADAGATSVVGGGDSAAALALAGVADRITHVSTGGGASLEFLEGRELPGVAALTDRG